MLFLFSNLDGIITTTSGECLLSWRELEQANHHGLKFKLLSALSDATRRTYMLKFKLNDKLLFQAVWLCADRTFVSWVGTLCLLWADFGITWCTPCKLHLSLCGVHHLILHGAHYVSRLWYYVVYTMWADFDITWCTPCKQILVFHGVSYM